jgi:hypothetical protein
VTAAALQGKTETEFCKFFDNVEYRRINRVYIELAQGFLPLLSEARVMNKLLWFCESLHFFDANSNRFSP